LLPASQLSLGVRLWFRRLAQGAGEALQSGIVFAKGVSCIQSCSTSEDSA
jgi:hypothetical protein